MGQKKQSYSVLIIEDNPESLQALSDTFSSLGYVIRVALNGAIGLESALKEIPDIIFMDINMPMMDGYETCGKLKANPLTSQIPVIFLSDANEPVNKVKAYGVGAVDLMTKPVEMDEARQKIKIHVQLVQRIHELEDEGGLHKLQNSSAKLKELMAFHRILIDSSPIGLVLCDMNGKILTANEKYLNIIGYTADEATALTCMDITPLDYQEKEIIQLEDLEKRGQYGPYEKEYIHKDGHRIPVKLSGNIVVRNNERYIWSAVEDITPLKQSIEELRQSEARKRAILESTVDGIIVINQKGIIDIFSPSASKIFGYSSDEVIGKNVNILMPEPFHSEHDGYIENYLKGGGPKIIGFTREVTGKRKNGELFPMELTVSIVKGEVINFVGTVRDITQRHENECQLIEAKEAAEAAAHAKTAFLANMSHEIRTPMNAIIGMAHLAMETEMNPKQLNYIEKIHRSAENLLGIINDILDFSKIETGNMKIENIPFHFEEVLESVINIVGMQAYEKKLELIVDMDIDLPMLLIGDPLRLGQVLLNLCNNAIKFSKNGKNVMVEITHEPIDASTVLIKMVVIDEGIGMSEDERQKLFTPFVQGDVGTTRKYGGTGLGLSISKKLVELMGGQIWCESEPEIGSSFYFTARLGVQRGSHSLKTDELKSLFSDLSALIVEENEMVRGKIHKMLESLSMNVISVASFQEGVSKIQEQTRPFHLIFCADIYVRDLEKLKEMIDPEHSKMILICNLMVQDKMCGRQSKTFDFNLIHKPLTTASLLDAVLVAIGREKMFSQRRILASSSIEEITKKLSGAKILLVEDNEINQELAQELLMKHGIEVTVADNGQVALDLLEQESFDGILMDCQMPLMDGLTATKFIRENPKTSNVPIIAITANAMDGEREKVIQLGMNDYVSKPLNIVQMLHTLARWVKPANSVPIEKQQYSVKTEKGDKMFDFKTIDSLKGLDTVEDDVELYVRLLTRFKNHIVNYKEQLTSAIEAENFDEIVQLAHSLKGLAGNIGAMKIFDASAKVEFAAANERETIRTLLKILFEALEEGRLDLEEIDKDPKSETLPHEAITLEKFQEQLEELKRYLEAYDTDAVEVIAKMPMSLAGLEQYNQNLSSMVNAVKNFKFKEALSELKEIETLIVEKRSGS